MYLPWWYPCQKAYKVYDLESYHTFVSRDVKFHEYVFPFAHVNPTPAHCPLSKIPLAANAVDPIPPTNLSPPKPSLLPSSHSDSTTVPYTQPRRSQRDHQQLSSLNDFVCHIDDRASTPTLRNFTPTSLKFMASLSVL